MIMNCISANWIASACGKFNKLNKIRYPILLLVLIHLMDGGNGKSIPKVHYIHTNVCPHITPQPKVYLSNMFDTKDYFFPQYYTERKCVSPKSTSGSSQPTWATCINGQYHCVTRYRMMEFLRMPHPGNGTFASASVEVISYGDSYVPVSGISGHKRRKKAIKAFVAIISITAILTYLKLNLINKTQANNQSTKKRFRHSNPCRHVTPEPEIMLQEKFDSDDYFFPDSYKERICAAPKKSENQDQELKELQACFTDSIK
ncbi:Hypothetical predicted protein, partial [Paramuricea clavata]